MIFNHSDYSSLIINPYKNAMSTSQSTRLRVELNQVHDSAVKKKTALSEKKTVKSEKRQCSQKKGSAVRKS
jgi:hypothetical protein